MNPSISSIASFAGMVRYAWSAPAGGDLPNHSVTSGRLVNSTIDITEGRLAHEDFEGEEKFRSLVGVCVAIQVVCGRC